MSHTCGTSKACQSAQTKEHAHLLAAITHPSRVLYLSMKANVYLNFNVTLTMADDDV